MEYSSIFYQISIVLCKPVDYQQSPRSCCNRPTRSGSSSLCIGKCLMQSAQLVIYNLSLSPRLRNISPPSYRSSHYFLWQRDTQKYSELFFFFRNNDLYLMQNRNTFGTFYKSKNKSRLLSSIRITSCHLPFLLHKKKEFHTCVLLHNPSTEMFYWLAGCQPPRLPKGLEVTDRIAAFGCPLKQSTRVPLKWHPI